MHQGEALAAVAGVELQWQAPKGVSGPTGAQSFVPLPIPVTRPGRPRWQRLWDFLAWILATNLALDRAIAEQRPDAVLLPGWSEYFAPLWAWQLRRWRRRGVRFGAVIHDPVRSHQVGPLWWHRWSMAQAYSFLDVAFVHEPIKLETGSRCFPALQTVVIPHGIYHFGSARQSRLAARERLGLPGGKPVFLSFGHIRDGKNLDLFFQAMERFPEVHLIVAGKEQSSGQRPVAYYQQLAERLGVAARVRWEVRYIEENEVGLFFDAADFLLLTYSADFRSASGVLAAAAHFKKTVLASSGAGPLQNDVRAFALGEWVEPDSQRSLEVGLARLLASPLSPNWAGYCEAHSWERNAALVSQHLVADKAVQSGSAACKSTEAES
ncbi:glycosyltransferase [Synoicihabitans lomoniglobus]|uniref:glycosyltransferase n=1 Tax=Synoicihabitans lomoniglobus TaxID=2909285 RepID=UPI002ED35064|nr:glycosyltransferase [Opitutaceae bacterium LMO-M01]